MKEQNVISEIGMQYLKDGRMAHIPMLESLKRGSAEVIASSGRGVALKEKKGRVHMISAADAKEGLRMLDMIDESYMMVVQSEELSDYAVKKFGFTRVLLCYYGAYLKKEKVLFETPLRIVPARADTLPLIKENYHLLPEEELTQIYEEGNFFCAFEGDSFVGFSGFHLEGSMGLLEILPQYQRKGYGMHLESFMINEALRRDKIPYVEIIADNAASLNLQKKLGLTMSKTPVWWMY